MKYENELKISFILVKVIIQGETSAGNGENLNLIHFGFTFFVFSNGLSSFRRINFNETIDRARNNLC